MSSQTPNEPPVLFPEHKLVLNKCVDWFRRQLNQLTSLVAQEYDSVPVEPLKEIFEQIQIGIQELRLGQGDLQTDIPRRC